MPDIAMQVGIEAPARDVYQALTTTEGIAGWWTDRNHTTGLTGQIDWFDFPGAPTPHEFRVDAAEPAKVLSWHCLAGPPQWLGTDVRWTISPAPAGHGSLVVFDHAGFAEVDDMFRIVTLGWAQIILKLKRYLETGRPDPFFRN